jgi:hypothetical protein
LVSLPFIIFAVTLAWFDFTSSRTRN